MNRFTVECRDDWDSQALGQEIIANMIKRNWIYDPENPQLIVCVGGDGTLLKAFHRWLNELDRVAFVGIHTGMLGFATDYTQDELEDFYQDIKKKPELEEKRILKALCKKGQKVISINALNEIRVENIVKTQTLDVYINQEYFETFRGNGLCISGQHGSTAYNRSINGAIIYPGLDLLQMTEISGIHHHRSRSIKSPLILAPDTEITLRSHEFAHALLCYDYMHLHLDDYQEVSISSYEKPIRLAHFRKISHLKRLSALF